MDPIPKIVSGLRHIARELSVHSKFIQDNYNITVPQLVCLREICDNESISLGELTRSLHLNNSTVTGIIDRLEKRNLVRRVRQSRDRRQRFRKGWRQCLGQGFGCGRRQRLRKRWRRLCCTLGP